MMHGFSFDWPAYYYLVALVLFGLAAYRVTRLILFDHVLDRLRSWVWRHRPPENGGIGYMLTCAWCTGFWVSSLFVIAYIIVPEATTVAAFLLSVSAIVGLLAARDGS